MDAWFEEDEEVFTHVRSPYARIDILPSSREVVVTAGDVELARTTRAHALFETGLPTRWYVPRVDTHMDLLTESATVTRCPYKGTTVTSRPASPAARPSTTRPGRTRRRCPRAPASRACSRSTTTGSPSPSTATPV